MSTLIYKGKKYELPAKNMAIVEAEELMHTESKGLVEAYLKQFDFLKALFNDEALTELLGSTDVNAIDFTDVTLLCNMVDSAYLEKIHKLQMSDLEKIASNVAINKIIKASESLKNSEK